MNEYALEMDQICKSFNGVVVLDHVNFKVKQGEVHAIIGGNGAGKSTLMKILTGVYTNDGGTIRVNGKEVKFNNPNDSKNNGVTMIFQELSLVPTLTVAENIFLNQEPVKNSLIDYKTIRNRTKEILDSFEIDIDPDAVVGDLSVGYCQLIEIAKALSRETKILVMDEPTASLSESETVILFNLVRRLKAKGVSIVYISHRMSEIFGIADAITVLRDGKNIITESSKDINMEQVIEYMIGSKMEKAFEWVERDYKGDNSTILEVKSLSVGTSVNNVSFKLKKGEVLGIAGLMASGRTEILESIFGIRKRTGGNIILEGKEVHINNVQDAIENGIALVPEDRRRQGLVLDHTVKENLTLPILKRLQKFMFIDDKKSNDIVDQYIKQLNIKTDGGNKVIKLLSGGNQQKVVIAKWLVNSPKVLLLDEPTAGVDVGAKGEIIDIVRKFANTGNSVMLVSSELAELLAVCDRILVLHDGILTKELNRKDINSEEVLQHAIQQS
jgi:ribose transport system ATP-binding protein